MRGLHTFFGLFAAFLSVSTAHAYYGRNSTEAELTFSTHADVELSGSPTKASLNREGRVRNAALEAVDAQIQHLMGTFQSESFRKDFGFPGVLGEHYEIKFTDIAPGTARGRLILSYDFTGKVVFDKRAFSSSVRKVPLKLPLSPDLIYALGNVHGKNRCTDDHYNDEGDFWYFWDPELRGCPLRGNSEQVVRLEGRIEKMANTRATYPEYDRLFGDNGNGKAFDIALLLGYLNDLRDYRRVNRRDDAYRELRDVSADLENRGFELTEKVDGFREFTDGLCSAGANFLRRYEKTIRALGKEVKVRVLIVLADTEIEARDGTFHNFLMPALRSADIMIYDGHSGLGSNLDLGQLPPARFRSNKYQIFFFNGCSSYPYYNGMFFDAKGGSKNLDVVTSGLPTFSTSGAPNVIAFLDRFIDGETRTWQTILGEVEASNGAGIGTYLTGVSGDEDNCWKP